MLRVSPTKEVTYEQMPKENGKVKMITKDKSSHKEGTDPLVPSVGCMADAFKNCKEASVTAERPKERTGSGGHSRGLPCVMPCSHFGKLCWISHGNLPTN